MASFTLSTFLGVAVLSSMVLESHGVGIELLQGSCPDGWFYHNSRCFRHFSDKKTWIDAEVNCINLGGNLASVHSEDEHQFLQQLHLAFDRVENEYWIGMSDLYKDNGWFWTDGTNPRDFSKWNPREPNHTDNTEHCVNANYGGLKGWNDILCTRTFASICAKRLNDLQYQAEPTP
ncbi:lactose-binding lectin l-2-like [Anguilla anguilla]|uniref:lactose-binding lectin l-2-like n=1 Tax=Anguilla anguilla TaxID=7936 RepID=UPI0015AF7C8F|nr:lactose-binding lectin l-2-like [Anguilla anguilla]